jgi:hypothetical protein
MFYSGSTATWEWFLRATNLGRVVFHALRLANWLFRDAWRERAPHGGPVSLPEGGESEADP